MSIRSKLRNFNPYYMRWWFVNRKNWIPTRLTYTAIRWFVYVICFVCVLVDRVWLSQTHGDLLIKRASRDKLPVYRGEGRIGTYVTEWIWVTTARTLIVSLNMAFYTVMWVLPNFLEEVAPSFIDMDVRHSNWQVHNFAGIWLNGVVVVLHCSLLLAPWAIDGAPLNMRRDGIDFGDWWDPFVRTFSYYIEDGQVVFSVDEVFRLVLSIFLFCIIFPVSRANWMMYRSYSVAMGIHAAAGFAFMIDMVRKNSHPLCWRFNLPLIFLYIFDRLFATFWYRVNKFRVRRIQKVSESCFVMYGFLSDLDYNGQGCADNYWLLHRFQKNAPCTPVIQRSHPYTSFQNWDPDTRNEWNVGFVIQMNPKNASSWSLWLMNR